MSHAVAQAVEKSAPPKLVGLLAEFDSPGALIDGAELVRDAGFRKWDAHSPFPVHGIDAAMGIRPTRLPFIVFACGFIGCMLGLGLQYWTNATNSVTHPGAPNFVSGYDFVISGKPRFSLPANIPVTFEVTVLLSAFAAVFGMLALNNLPWHHSALFHSPRFRRVTNDKFFIFVDAADPKFSESRSEALLSGAGAVAVERITEPPGSAAWPHGWIVAFMVIGTLALLPPMWVFKARSSKSSEPRIQVIQDMDNQERFRTQQASALFADGRSSRPQAPGTVARGDWPRDAHFHEGKVGGEFAIVFPPQIELNESFVKRGQQRFNIYCAPCHGLDGGGQGIVNERAQRLSTDNWVQPSSMHDDLVVGRPLGHIFNTITNGIRSMPPYGDQITPADRWAIVAYIRALEYSQKAPVADVPEALRPKQSQR